ncbi:hypothetical protein MASR1M60_21680 [Rhodocyclaceae bacterium]
MAISSPGIGSGLDINSIITKLMSVEQQPLSKLDVREASYQSKISALGSLKGAVSALNGTLASLVPSKITTAATTATIANTSAAVVTANASAATGTYDLEIDQLATAHKLATVAQSQRLASGTYANAFSAVAQGTLNIAVGGGTAVPVTINAGNATLTGLKNAINAAGAGVTADIIPDGGSVRLVLTSNTIGTAGKVTTSGLAGFDFDGSSGSLTEDTAQGGRAASGFSSITDTIATGTLNIQIGNGTARQVVIDNTNNTLNGLKNAINNAGAGVTAELVTVGNNNIRLVLTANSTGADSVITTSGLAGFDYDADTASGSLSQSSIHGGQLAQDAMIKLDGVSSSYSSNTITAAIANVSLRLTATTDSATKLTVASTTGSTFAEQASAKFRSFKGAVSDSSATAAVTASAVPGSYSFQVMQLATTHRITTPSIQAHQLTTLGPRAQIQSSAVFGSSADVTDGVDGSLNIAVGSNPGFSVAVTAGTTLEQLKDLINNAGTNTGVTASVVNSRLQLSSGIAGAGGDLSITDGGGLSALVGGLSTTQTSRGYSSSADSIAQGTLSIAVGDGAAVDVTIDGSNNTLAGLRDAINTANAGVTASIVTDGSGVRLVIASNNAGRTGAVSLSGLAGFAFNNGTQDLSDAAADGGAAAQGFVNANATVPTGTLQLQLGNGTARNITIDTNNNSLEGIKNTINAGAYGVTASLLKISDTDTRLVLTSNTIGSAGRISLSGIAGLAFDGATGTGDLSQSTAEGGQAAQGSIIKLNGTTIQSDSNTITDALQGVTLNLSSVSTSSSTLTISQDKTSSLGATLSNVVKAYNELNKVITELGKYDSASKSGGPLLGNSTLRQVASSVRNVFQTTPAGLTSTSIKRLSDIGIEVQKDGSLTFNSNKLTTAANSDYDAVALLAASFGQAAKTATDAMLDSKSGSITAATDGLNTSIKNLENQRETLSRRLAQIEARYRRQFSSLDTLIASMNQTSSYLSQQLASLPSAKSSS